ncbi:MAG: 4Fe-4S binding protein [Nanoarchaeota archaeon]|nr:4Fe-4S binding protein [Nanoarchaeota archaeon]MBU1135603.1 4Fe-4S binding protein [Nanoarchaeota archaeon]MBU2519785.1 4Fe-4S binding protein [Nanoarchaeota archaeon]
MIEESKLRYERIRGVPHLRDPGNSVRSGTYKWRVFKPVWDMKKCTKCKQCWLFCPDTAIGWKGKPVWDKQTCKGCLVCVNVCPVKAITAVRDEHEGE